MNIKVCGITQVKQLRQLDGLGIDFAGLIFVPDSPRYVVGKIEGEELVDADFDLRKTGVFRDAGYDTIMDAVDTYGLDIVQLHGAETPALCKKLAAAVEVMKAFAVNGEEDVDALLAPYDAVCDYYLFDTKTANGQTGGTGEPFDWNILAEAKIEKPFLLSGGIGPGDAKRIKAFTHPDFYGIDINSRFETEPGVKDMKLILAFLQELKQLGL